MGDKDTSPDETLTWTTEAEARLQRVPQGAMQELTRQRVEELARRRGQPTVTVGMVEEKYSQWAEGVAQATSEVAWTEEARDRIERVPAFVRGMVVKAIEAYARKNGLAEVTTAIVEEAKAHWGSTGRFHRP